MKQKLSQSVFTFGLTFLVLCAATASAQDPVLSLYDRTQVSLSFTDVIMNADIRIDSESGSIGTEIDTEEDLGLPTHTFQPRAGIRWRPWHDHEFELTYQFARRDGEKVLNRDIKFRDTTFNAGLKTKGQLNTDQALLVYRFAVIAKDDIQAGVGLGIGAFFLDTEVEVLASVSGGPGKGFKAEGSLVGPSGSLGIYGRFLTGGPWYIESDLRYLRINIDPFLIQVLELGGAGRYFFSEKYAVELGYAASAVRIDASSRRDKVAGVFKFSLQSIRLGGVVVL